MFDLVEFAVPTEKPNKAEKPQMHSASNSDLKTETALQITTQENVRLWEENRQLKEVDNRLAYNLGAREQRIKDLENVLEKTRKLLPATQVSPPVPTATENVETTTGANKIGVKSWWKRLFRL